MNVKRLLIGEPMRLAHIDRYAIYPCIFKESVAEHSYYTALYTMLLCTNATSPVDSNRALRLALLHDFNECFYGDLNGPFKSTIKHHWKPISDKLKAMGFEVFTEMAGQPSDKVLNMNTDTTEYHIVKLADFMCVVAFLSREKQAGNGLFMSHIDMNHVMINMGKFLECQFLKDAGLAVIVSEINDFIAKELI